MNSLIDIHTTHFLSQSHSQKIALCERALSLLSLKKDLGNFISTGHINRRTSINFQILHQAEHEIGFRQSYSMRQYKQISTISNQCIYSTQIAWLN